MNYHKARCTTSNVPLRVAVGRISIHRGYAIQFVDGQIIFNQVSTHLLIDHVGRTITLVQSRYPHVSTFAAGFYAGYEAATVDEALRQNRRADQHARREGGRR